MKEVWNALTDRTRREILAMLKTRPHTAGELSDQFDLTAATVSHHLHVLKECGLVTTEKRAQTIIYTLNQKVVRQTLSELADLLEEEKE